MVFGKLSCFFLRGLVWYVDMGFCLKLLKKVFVLFLSIVWYFLINLFGNFMFLLYYIIMGV